MQEVTLGEFKENTLMPLGAVAFYDSPMTFCRVNIFIRQGLNTMTKEELGHLLNMHGLIFVILSLSLCRL